MRIVFQHLPGDVARHIRHGGDDMSSVPRPIDLTQVPAVPWAWVDEHVYAAIRGCSVKVLQNERRLNIGCPFRRINGTIIPLVAGILFDEFDQLQDPRLAISSSWTSISLVVKNIRRFFGSGAALGPDARAEIHLVRWNTQVHVRAWRDHAASVRQVFRAQGRRVEGNTPSRRRTSSNVRRLELVRRIIDPLPGAFGHDW
jgi:hypothetical protein